MKPISPNFKNQTIIMTNAFAKKASDPTTKEYRELKDMIKTFPSFKVVTHTIKKNSGKESFKGLNYDFMREYIETHVEVNKVMQALEDLEEQIYLTKCHSKKFPIVRKWFLETYPEINTNFGKVKAEFEKRKVIISNSETTEEDLCA